MVKHKLVSFAFFVASWTLVTLLKKLIRIPMQQKHIQAKNYAILAAMLRKRSYFVKNVSFQSPGLFTLITEISVAKNRANSAFHVYRSKFNVEKTSDARSRKPSQPSRPGSQLVRGGLRTRELRGKVERCKVSAARKGKKCHALNQPTFLSILMSCFLCFFSSFVSSLFLVVLRGVWV